MKNLHNIKQLLELYDSKQKFVCTYVQDQYIVLNNEYVLRIQFVHRTVKKGTAGNILRFINSALFQKLMNYVIEH